MKSVARAVLAIATGMGLAFALAVAVEFFSSIVHPFPANFDGNVAEHVRRYPAWILGVVVLAWGGTAAAATWVASKIGGLPAGIIVALLLAWALVFNVSMLPYAKWFKVAMLCAFPTACAAGVRYGRRVPPPAVRSASITTSR
jgi:hypothetical protein